MNNVSAKNKYARKEKKGYNVNIQNILYIGYKIK